MYWSAKHSSGALGFGQVQKNRKGTSPPHSNNTLQKTIVQTLRASFATKPLAAIADRRNGNDEDIYFRPIYYIYKTQPAYH